jgi:glutamate-1-semialdehyde 2,1-aminomutase
VALRRACTEHNVILIFDEVMTSRLSTGGYQAMVGVTPDMTTLGKYLGGGMSFGAFGGRMDLMARFDPERADAWPHAGTFNNNVLSMAAGLAGLKKLLNGAAINKLNRKGDRLRQAINDVARRHDVGLKATGTGSFVGMHFTRDEVRRPGDLDPADAERRTRLQNLMHLDLIAAGQFYARRGFIALMLPITDAEIETFAGAVEEFVTSRKSLLQ